MGTKTITVTTCDHPDCEVWQHNGGMAVCMACQGTFCGGHLHAHLMIGSRNLDHKPIASLPHLCLSCAKNLDRLKGEVMAKLIIDALKDENNLKPLSSEEEPCPE